MMKQTECPECHGRARIMIVTIGGVLPDGSLVSSHHWVECPICAPENQS